MLQRAHLTLVRVMHQGDSQTGTAGLEWDQQKVQGLVQWTDVQYLAGITICFCWRGATERSAPTRTTPTVNASMKPLESLDQTFTSHPVQSRLYIFYTQFVDLNDDVE